VRQGEAQANLDATLLVHVDGTHRGIKRPFHTTDLDVVAANTVDADTDVVVTRLRDLLDIAPSDQCALVDRAT